MKIKKLVAMELSCNPDRAYTVESMAKAIKKTKNRVYEAMTELFKEGQLIRKADPKFRRRWIFELKKENFIHPVFEFTHPVFEFTHPVFESLIYYIINKRNKHMLNKTLKFTPEVLNTLNRVNELFEKSLSTSERDLVRKVSDESTSESTSEVARLIQSKLKTFIPMLSETVSVASVLASTFDPPPVRTPVVAESSSSPESSSSSEETKALKSARRGVEKFNSNKPKAKTLKKKTPKNRITEMDRMKCKDVALSSDPFAPHIRYFRFTPDYRSFLFAQAFVRVVKEQFRWRQHKAWTDALIGEVAFRQSTNIYHFITKARIEADMLRARYEDFILGICRYYHDLNMKNSGDKIPRYDHLSGVEHVHAAHSYLTNATKILLTIDDISYSENAAFLMPGEFGSTTFTPQEHELSLIFYHDVVFPELERLARIPGNTLNSAVDNAIRYGLLPQQWAEGYGFLHRLEELKTYKYKAPEHFIPESIFKSVA